MGKDPRSLSDAELLEAVERLRAGADGELEFEIEAKRQAALRSPYYYATEIVDEFYRDNFEYRHAQLLDECLAPWVLGEDVTLDGVTYDPKDYIGLFVGWPRCTYKSSSIRLLLGWAYPYFKIKLKEDLTCMMVHQVQNKAIDHGESVRNVARFNQDYRKIFPEFAVNPDKDWDRMDMWRWPNMSPKSRMAQLWSFVAYGETSSKIGGHYSLRLVDDWESEDSVTTPEMISNSERRLKQFDNLGIRGRKHNPWIVAGTYYHYDGTYRRLEKSGGWLSWVLPAHEGPSKQIFDLVGLDQREPEQKAKIDAGIKKLEVTRSEDLNFPKIYPWRELYKAAMGQRTDDDGELRGGFYEYSCQVLMNPVPKGQTRFDYDALQAAWVDELPPPEHVNLYIRIDPAISKKKRSADTAVVVGAVKYDRHRYILQTWLGQERRPTIILRRAFSYVRKWQSLGYQVQSIGIENTAFQESMRQQALEGIPERDAAYDGEEVPIIISPCKVVGIPRGPDVTKTERQLSLDGPIGRREVHFWSKDPMGRKLWQQFERYPYDKFDGIDAVYDLWTKVEAPPAPMVVVPSASMSPTDILRALGIKPREETRQDMSQACRLRSWR